MSCNDAEPWWRQKQINRSAWAALATRKKYSPATRRKPSHPAAQANSNNNDNGGGFVARQSRPPPPPPATPSPPSHHPSNIKGQPSPPAGALSPSTLPSYEPPFTIVPTPRRASDAAHRGGGALSTSEPNCPRRTNTDEPGGEYGDGISKGGGVCFSEEDGKGRRPPSTTARVIAATTKIALGICRPHPRTAGPNRTQQNASTGGSLNATSKGGTSEAKIAKFRGGEVRNEATKGKTKTIQSRDKI